MRGKAYKIPRTYINRCAYRDDIENTGVYFLFGRNDETDAEQVYIGEAENILSRLKQHLSEKDFWTECIAFICKRCAERICIFIQGVLSLILMHIGRCGKRKLSDYSA